MNFRKSNYNTCISIIHSLFQPFPPFSLQLSNSDPPPSPPKPNIHSLVRLTDHTLWGLLYRAAHPSYTLLLPFPPQLSKSNPHPTPPPSKNRRLTDCDLLQTAAVTPLWDGPSMGSPAYQTPSDPPTSYDTRRRGHA